MESLPVHTYPPSVLSNSTSWSGSLGYGDSFSRSELDHQQTPAQLEQTRQTRRSWARSKRISLGCLEWRTNQTFMGRTPRPKSVTQRLDIPPIGEVAGGDRDTSDASSLVCTHVAYDRVTRPNPSDSSTPTRSSQRAKASGGADALLRRLRMRPGSKNTRAKTPTPVCGEMIGRSNVIPLRSSSTPRTSYMSKSFVEWSGTGAYVLSSCSHGSRLNMVTDGSGFSQTSVPQRTESYPSVGLCPNPSQCSCVDQFANPMTRSFMPCCGIDSFNTQYGRQTDQVQMSVPSMPFPCMAKCCQPTRSIPDGYLAAPNVLYRPLSQPTCYFLGHGNTSGTDSQECNGQRPLTHYSTLPWPVTSSVMPDNDQKTAISSHSVLPWTGPAHNATYWSGMAPQPMGLNTTHVPGPMLSSCPSVSRHGFFGFPSSKTTEALFVSCGDSTAQQTHWPVIPPHPSATSTPLKPAPMQNFAQPAGHVHSPRARSNEQPRDQSLTWNSAPPHFYTIVPASNHHGTANATTAATETSNQTRPDSLLSSSSLTTADSSQTDSLPNSSSSRDSAIGGNPQPAVDHGGLGKGNLVEMTGNTVQAHHPMHQPHPNPHHQQNQHHSQLPIHQSPDSRTWRVEESLCVTRPNTDPKQRLHPHLPPAKPTSLGESRLPPTPTRSIAWPPRLTTLPDFAGSRPCWPSQKARAERKHSVYVNAAIYPLREQPQSQIAGDQSHSAGGLTTVQPNDSTRRSPPASWTHLLPYRMSTVPQNLSERLKKSETLPNDVWVQARRPEKDSTHAIQPNSHPSSKLEQGVWQNGSDGMPVGLKSPPPRPPVRTSSQQLSMRAASSEARVARTNSLSNSTVSQEKTQSTETSLSGLLASEQHALEDSPILCRYSQLYSLSLKPISSDQANNNPKSKVIHSDSPLLPSNRTPTMSPDVQLRNLRICSDDLS